MKFLLDENVSVLIEPALKKSGHAILRLSSSAKDKEILAAAQKEKAVILTHDKDFLALPAACTEGVIVARIHPPWAKNVLHSLEAFLAKLDPNEWKGKLVLLEKEGFHIRF